jgi:hypothetical protein
VVPLEGGDLRAGEGTGPQIDAAFITKDRPPRVRRNYYDDTIVVGFSPSISARAEKHE